MFKRYLFNGYSIGANNIERKRFQIALDQGAANDTSQRGKIYSNSQSVALAGMNLVTTEIILCRRLTPHPCDPEQPQQSSQQNHSPLTQSWNAGDRTRCSRHARPPLVDNDAIGVEIVVAKTTIGNGQCHSVTRDDRRELI